VKAKAKVAAKVNSNASQTIQPSHPIGSFTHVLRPSIIDTSILIRRYQVRRDRIIQVRAFNIKNLFPGFVFINKLDARAEIRNHLSAGKVVHGANLGRCGINNAIPDPANQLDSKLNVAFGIIKI
jgi:hypothetical protein